MQECSEWLKYQLRMLIKCSERAQNMFRTHLWRHTTCLQDNFGDDQGGEIRISPYPTDQQILPLTIENQEKIIFPVLDPLRTCVELIVSSYNVPDK